MQKIMQQSVDEMMSSQTNYQSSSAIERYCQYFFVFGQHHKPTHQPGSVIIFNGLNFNENKNKIHHCCFRKCQDFLKS